MYQKFSKMGQNYQGSPIDLNTEGLLPKNLSPIFLSIGEPHPHNIPSAKLQLLSQDILLHQPVTFKYGNSAGNEVLREYLLNIHKPLIPNLTLENILITSGSTQGMDLLCKLLINPGDVCIVESPSYSNTFNTMKNYGADVVELPIDSDGLNPELLEETLIELKRQGRSVKCVCIIPNAQNPSGVTLSGPRRIEIVELAKRYDFLIIEDDPYESLTFSNDKEKPMIANDENLEYVMYLNSFSKIIAPGLRVGWMVAHREIIHKLSMMKQSTDCCSNPITQNMVASFCQKGWLEPHVEQVRRTYYQNKEVMMNSLRETFGHESWATWTNPKGGMFVWMSLPPELRDVDVLLHAQQQGVVFVPGHVFSPSFKYHHHIRLCFGYCQKHEIQEGIRRLRQAIDNAYLSMHIKDKATI
ncbi:hypothetical protein CN918_31460 [Priestia megaterium]|nr:hypothetical protein CN918_31460 [Priestia megaterium]